MCTVFQINSSLRVNVTKNWVCLNGEEAVFWIGGGVYLQVVWKQIHFSCRFCNPEPINFITAKQLQYDLWTDYVVLLSTCLPKNFLTDQERGMRKQKHPSLAYHLQKQTHTLSASRWRWNCCFHCCWSPWSVCVWFWCVFWFVVHESCCYEYKWKATVNRRTPRTSSIWLHHLTPSWLLTKKLSKHPGKTSNP